MVKLSTIKAKDIIKVLNKLGFQEIRQHSDGRTTVVPYHPDEDISKPLLREILKDIKISPEEFLNVLKKKIV